MIFTSDPSSRGLDATPTSSHIRGSSFQASTVSRPSDWLAPYDTDVSGTSAGYRRAWGGWIVAKLDREAGGLAGAVIEVHAPDSYVDPIRHLLTSAGAALELPLRNVPYDEWPDWYERQLSGSG